MVVEVHRPADLLDVSVAQHRDPISERHCLHLVVGDVNHRSAECFVQLCDFHAHIEPQRGVQVGKRLVEQKYRRIAHDRASDSDTLALPARQLRGAPVEQVFHLKNARRLGDLLLFLAL